MFISFNNCGAVQPVVSVERTVFYREKAAGLYSAMPYAMAQASSQFSSLQKHLKASIKMHMTD
jgi:hypothetical protein